MQCQNVATAVFNLVEVIIATTGFLQETVIQSSLICWFDRLSAQLNEIWHIQSVVLCATESSLTMEKEC